MSTVKKIADMVDRAKIYPLARITPLDEVWPNVWLKREDRQSVFSFKIRGASNCITNLSGEQKQKGVVCASAGNHAQGVARAAVQEGVGATIFMPITTPEIKVRAVKKLGAKVKLVGDNYDDANKAAKAFADKSGAVFVHPFNDDWVIAGQGTIGKEILEQLEGKSPARIYIPVGGGGLLAGIGAYMKTHSPDTKIIAVEPKGAATLHTSLKQGRRVALENIDSFADGVAVKHIGNKTFKLALAMKPETILVSNDQISAAIKKIFEKTRTLVEPAGALALAGFLADKQNQDDNSPVIIIVSGANVNFDRIGHIVERAELGAGGEILFSASLEEKPGAFMRFCDALGDNSVSEFNYRYGNESRAHVLVGIKTGSRQEGLQILTKLRAQGMEVVDLSHNRIAKEHIRHMVGGRLKNSNNEQVYSFEFPERPGALRSFLASLEGRWNISLFHYRNHGAATAQILCGFQVSDDEINDLEQSLEQAGFVMRRITDNPAVQSFL